MTQSLSDWALPQLSRLLPLDEDSLKQIVTYSDSLSKESSAEHLKELLGDSPQALEFISSFQIRRPTPPSEARTTSSNPASRDASESEVPRPSARPRKKKQPFNKLPPARQVQQLGDTPKAYVKKSEDDYMTGTTRHGKAPSLSNTLALQSEPDALQLPVASSTTASPSRSPAAGSEAVRPSKLPPSAAGTLISDATASAKSSRSASPANASKQLSKAKITVPGGTSMRGASSTLSDLDSAIRALEIQTNPTLAPSGSTTAEEETKRRRCNCMAQRHPLLAAAPNCLSCGKIICVKEGLGPCTFCGKPLLSSADLHAMIRVLRDERGKEKMSANNAAHKRADVAQKPRAFAVASSTSLSNPGSTATTPRATTPTPSPFSSNAASTGDEDGNDDADQANSHLAAAKAHRDRLLQFQAQNARRTTVHDEAADFSTPDDGTSAWASPAERALQLKRQQKALREQEWNARPEWEKRRVVVSLDVKGGKAVRRMAAVERPESPAGSGDEEGGGGEGDGGGTMNSISEIRSGSGSGSGTFSRNPLLAGLIKPVFHAKGKEKAVDVGGAGSTKPASTWRRVQDDNDDNEQWILDGGAYAGRVEGRVLAAEEQAYG